MTESLAFGKPCLTSNSTSLPEAGGHLTRRFDPDSLAEAYMNDGDRAQAIANYQRSLQINPRNTNAVKMLQKLNAP